MQICGRSPGPPLNSFLFHFPLSMGVLQNIPLMCVLLLGEPLQVTVRPMLRDRCPVCLSSVQRWCIVAKRLDGSR